MFMFIAMLMGVNAWAEDLNLDPTGVTYVCAGTPDEAKYDAAATSWLANFSKLSGGKLTDQLAAYGGSTITIVKFDASSLPANATVTAASVTFNSACTVASKNSQLAISTIGTDWEATTATWNNVDLTATFVADLAWSAGNTNQSADVKAVLTSDEDKVVAFAIYTNTGREQSVSNFKLNVTYTTESIAEFEYTVNAVDPSGNVIAQIETGKCLQTDNKVVYAPYAVEKDGKWYVIQNADFANPITASGEVVVTYELDENVAAFVDLNNDAKGNYSAGAVGHTSGVTSNMKTGASLGTVAPAKYKAVTSLAANGNRGIYIRDINSTEADNTIATMPIDRNSAAGIYETAEFEVAAATELIVTGYTSGSGANQSADVDYVVLIKTGDVAPAEKATLENVTLTVAEGEKIDEDGDFKITVNYAIKINDPAILDHSYMVTAGYKYAVYDAGNNLVDEFKKTVSLSGSSANFYVSDLEGGKEYTAKILQFYVVDKMNADYETNFGDTLAVLENCAEVKFIPVAADVKPVEIKNMSITNDPTSLIDEEGDYTVTFNYTGKINDETIKAEDLYSVIKYQVYDEEYNLAASGTRDFDITAGSRNVYVSGLTAGKSYQFMVTGLVVINGETELLNLTSGLPKLNFKVKDPNAPQAISMKDMSFTVAEGEEIDSEGDFKVTFNYNAVINDPSAVNYPFAVVSYDVTNAAGEKVTSSSADFDCAETSKNLYISNLEQGKTYTVTATKIEIQDFMTMEMLCETDKDLPSLTFTAGAAPAPAHTWDFTNWSAETVANLEADYQKEVEEQAWSRIEKVADKDNREKAVEGCYWQVAHGTLTANGQEIAELKGLEFTNTNDRGLAIATNYPSTSLGEYNGPQYLWLGSKNIAYFTIKNVKVGSTIKIGIESHKPAEGRGVTLSNVAANPAAPTLFEEQQWTVTGDADVVDVVVTNTNGCHIYYIDAEIVDVPDGIQNATVNATVTAKFVKNGNIFIIKNGKMYNVNGAVVK